MLWQPGIPEQVAMTGGRSTMAMTGTTPEVLMGKLSANAGVFIAMFDENIVWNCWFVQKGFTETYILYIYIRNAWALPQRCSVEGSHSQSNVVATLHSLGKINKGIRQY